MYQDGRFRPPRGMALDTQVTVARRRYGVLAIDGGGIRGVIAAAVVEEIEWRIGRRTAEQFDLVAGTSTGGIIALGVTKPNANREPGYSAKELAGLYRDHGGEIFHDPPTIRIGAPSGCGGSS